MGSLNRIAIAAAGLFLGLIPTVHGRQPGADYIAGHYVAASPVPEQRSVFEANYLARKLAADRPGAFVTLGQGKSMQPLYPSGTLLVVQPQPYDQLTRGMTVVFRNKENRAVAHVLVARTADGWRTSGLNNRRADFTAVNAGNIQGVVIAAYTLVNTPRVALAHDTDNRRTSKLRL